MDVNAGNLVQPVSQIDDRFPLVERNVLGATIPEIDPKKDFFKNFFERFDL